ncbi:SLC13 family permease [Paracoccus cavernae]|uniref:SLC13 family permease n=1 Tax=Paracoccus cavernae TaxID=1571207 RepID=A0ABT8DCN9_9RHOB|nr:SLC13 family permease [Paracoccus cavernae]
MPDGDCHDHIAPIHPRFSRTAPACPDRGRGGVIVFGLTLPGALPFEARAALIAVALAMLGWIGTRLPESVVALVAVLGLVFAGVLSEEVLFSALGSELIWLLLSAFVIGAVLKEAQLTERLLARVLRRPMRFDLFALALTVAIAATAFVLPSTSGRAALLMPVFLALAGPCLIRVWSNRSH